jgi:hypothetical protein
MGNPVFANLMEVSSKSMGGKSICEFPDVCFTPPTTPATPPGVPVPYPNTGLAGDTTSGSRSVKIGGKEVMLKDRSYFKQSTGDEAGCAPKKGVVTSKIKGKVFFIAWSMDVKVEGENVVRNLDMTTHNHGSPANGAVPMVHVAKLDFPGIDACAADKQRVQDNCGEGVDPCPGSLKKTVDQQRAGFRRKEGQSRTAQAAGKATADASGSDCVKAMRCKLRPYKPNKKQGGCCPGQTPHHIPPKSMMKGVKGYSKDNALCVCLEGASQHVGSHGENHAAIDYIAREKSGKLDGKGTCTVAEYNGICAQAVAAQCGCDPGCIEAQLNGSFTEAQKNKRVKHYQSNSKQLSGDTKKKIDDAYKAAKKGSFSA